MVYAATEANYEAMVEVAKKYEVPLAVYAEGLEALDALVEKIVALGYKELVLDPGSRETAQVIADMTQIRRLAVKKRHRPLWLSHHRFYLRRRSFGRRIAGSLLTLQNMPASW